MRLSVGYKTSSFLKVYMDLFDYRIKEVSMQNALSDYVTPVGYRSSYKGVPFGRYAEVLPFIDFTKYYVMFRGPRPCRSQASTRKRDAKAFDVYMRSARDTYELRTEREAFQRGVEWANNRSH
jgi:hypothetical protein